MNISNERLSLFDPSLPWIHIVIPGKQLCDQAKKYVASWKNFGFSEPPTLGSILPSIIFTRYINSHNLLISYVEENVALSDINQNFLEQKFDDQIFPSWYFSNVCAVLLICSHFKPVQSIISHIKSNRSSDREIKIIELQHGWVVGKQSSLRRIGSGHELSNPDYYLVIDQLSAQHLYTLYNQIKIIVIGDILFSSQLLRHFDAKLISDRFPGSSENSSHKLLVCFSERDVELGYASQNFLKFKDKAFPRELLPLLSSLRHIYGDVTVKMRSKPHQDQSQVKAGFSSLKVQKCISDDLLWADSVASALSTVSLSSSYLHIPSYFYISNAGGIHRTLIEKYSSSIFHVNNNTNSDVLETYIQKMDRWAQTDLHMRTYRCLKYSRLTIANCYRLLDKILF